MEGSMPTTTKVEFSVENIAKCRCGVCPVQTGSD